MELFKNKKNFIQEINFNKLTGAVNVFWMKCQSLWNSLFHSSLKMDIFQSIDNSTNTTNQAEIENLLIHSVDPRFEYDQIWHGKIKDRKFVLENSTSIVVHPKRQPKIHPLSNRQRKRSGFFSLKGIKWDQVEFMHSLWLQYIAQLVDLSKDGFEIGKLESKISSNQSAFMEKLLKADFHGCIVSVLQSKNPLLVGLQGMVVRETPNTFILIQQSDSSLKTIPKLSCVFCFHIGNCSFNIYGAQFHNNASAERTTKKFKPKPVLTVK